MGAMRILREKILAGDAKGVGECLAGDAENKAKMAAWMAGGGHILELCRKKFGVEVFDRAMFEANKEIPPAGPMPGEEFLRHPWLVQGDWASNGMPNRRLIRVDGQWKLDVDSLMRRGDIFGRMADQVMQDGLKRWKSVEEDLAAGKEISALEVARRVISLAALP